MEVAPTHRLICTLIPNLVLPAIANLQDLWEAKRNALALNSGFRQRGSGSLRPCAELVEHDGTRHEVLQLEDRAANGHARYLLRAINATLRALEDRGRFFRNLIVAVVMVAGTSVLFAIIFLRWTPLFGLILIVPLVGGFLILDGRRVRRWRSEILWMCRAEAHDYSLFQKTMAGLGHLPAGTVRSMLATLPEQVDDGANALEGRKTDHFEVGARRDERKVLTATLLLTLMFSLLAASALYHSGTLLLCGVTLTLFFAILKTR